MNKTVIYTAIFGEKDRLIEPAFVPAGCDFICFTDQDFKSSVWKIVKEIGISDDPVRSAKLYKILPHKFLSEYENSVWVDGNILIQGDVNILLADNLSEANIAFFDHKKTKMDPRGSIYEEADSLLSMAAKGKVKDDPELIKTQILKYKSEGYPADNGLIVGMEILRRHNEQDVVGAMELWWSEIEKHSRRDQISFNYVAWKKSLSFVYLDGDSRDNQYFKWMPHEK